MTHHSDLKPNVSHPLFSDRPAVLHPGANTDLPSFYMDEERATVLVEDDGRIVAANHEGEKLFGHVGNYLSPSVLPATQEFTSSQEWVRREEQNADDEEDMAALAPLPLESSVAARIIIEGKPYRLLFAGKWDTNASVQEFEQLRRVAIKFQKSTETEKRRISREMYDELAQLLGAMKLDMDALSHERVAKSQSVSSRLERMQQLLRQALASTREIALTLHPPLLDDLGLIPALQWVAARFSKQSGIPCEVMEMDFPLEQEDPAGPAIYRLVEETLNEAGKETRLAAIRISLRKQGTCAEVRIEKQGHPTPETSQKMSQRNNYLAHIKEQFYLLGGTIGVRNLEPAGMLVHAVVPTA
ncbi:MAG: domain S-box protein [Paucimonas sp.]|nr:domain S-box protein [Paucimonas sp.]